VRVGAAVQSNVKAGEHFVHDGPVSGGHALASRRGGVRRVACGLEVNRWQISIDAARLR